MIKLTRFIRDFFFKKFKYMNINTQIGGGSNRGYKLVKITKSTNKEKKYMAIFKKKDDHLKIVHFGIPTAKQYPIHKNPDIKRNYINRHKKREDWNNPITPGALSRWILWNKPTIRESISDYRRKFNL